MAASAEEPAASSPSSPDVRSSEQQQPTPASGGDDAAELRRRVTDSTGCMEELGAAKGQWAGDVGRRLFVFGAFTTTLTACVAVVPAARPQLYQQAREQQPGAAEAAAAVGVCAVGSTPGPYPGIRLPRTSPIPGQVVTLDNVCVGLVVRRGPDWDKIYTNFMEAGVDGGPGNDGVVTDVSKTGRYASVRWNATGETSYSCNITGKPGYHELVVAPAEAQRNC